MIGPEEFEDLYEHAPCAYVSLSLDGLITRTNKTFAAWAAVERENLLGSRFRDCLNMASRIYFETHLFPLLRIQGFVNEVALEFSFGGGSKFPALVNVMERRNSDGSARSIQMTIFNATDRRRYEKELLAAHAAAQNAATEIHQLNGALQNRIADAETAHRKTEELLRQSQKMEVIGQLTGGIAHDFNNLIAGVTGSLELLERRLEQGRIDELSRYLSAARGAAKRAAVLTHRLLAFSRQQPLDALPTDVNRLLGDLEDMLRRSLGALVHLQVIGAVGLWTAVLDRNQLENAVLNLCINARDAMPGGGSITVETSNKWVDAQAGVERDMLPGQYVAVCVTDTGTGMTPEVLARAFDPFFTTKPSGLGTGLGLAMVQGFAQQAGGHVRTWKALHAEIILIVDDEPTVRMTISEAMAEAGYHTVEAADGPTALKLVESSTRFDLLITDFGLPGGFTGRQLADAARLKREDLKVLFITGYAENAVIENGLLAPDCGVLTKPFSLDALTQAVSALLPD
jgi:PAS domain S-box-containing protein